MAWTYTFTDLVSGEEIATLPMTGVSFEERVSGPGPLTGVVPTVDPKVRALDPWAATQPRRTGVYVEHDDEVIWGGIVWGRDRTNDVGGLQITAATFESWLLYQFRTYDLDTRGFQLGAPSTLSGLAEGSDVEGMSGEGVGYPWDIGQGGDGTGELRVAGKVYDASDLKSFADLLAGWVEDWGIPIEWRYAVNRASGGGYSQTLLINEGQFGDGRNRVHLSYPDGGLLTFKHGEDGTVQANTVIGSASGPLSTKLLSVAHAADVGSDEIAAGYPRQMASLSLSGSDTTQAYLDLRVRQELLNRLVQGEELSNLTLRPHSPSLASYRPGDSTIIEIIHSSFREWPRPAVFDGYRITSRKVSVGDGDSPDAVSITVVPPGDRLPRSVTLTAALRGVLARLRDLETP